MTYDEAVELIQKRAFELSNNGVFQKMLLERGITEPNDALDFAHQVAIATLYGV